MAKLSIYLLILVISVSFTFHLSPSMADATTSSEQDTSNFIKASCRTTLYPTLCLKCLSSYANKIQPDHKQLAQTALSVTLNWAEKTWVFLARAMRIPGLKPREAAALRDCVENMGGTVDQLKKSLKELTDMGKLDDQDFIWHMSNVQTWASTALTNQRTCLDGFSDLEGGIKTSVNGRVEVVMQVTSNALALVNRFALRHRRGSTSP